MKPKDICTRRQSAKLMLAAALPGAIVASQSAKGEEPPSEKGKVQYLFVQNGKDVSLRDAKMTLKGISGVTILFSDRPDRIAGHMTTADFVKNWNMGEDSFRIDNPNASLAIFGEKEPNDVVVELSNPVLENDDLSYDILVLEAASPSKAENARSSST